MKRTLPRCEGLLLEQRPSGVLHVVMNTPRTLNSFDDRRYEELVQAITYARDASDVKALVLSANGKYFSSGAALADRRLDQGGDSKQPDINNNRVVKLVDALIDFPKLAVAVVQGPAYGIAVTILALFDLVYASPAVTFTTPFSSLGICLEGCSSVTFPALLGQPLASRLLYLAETVPVDVLKDSQMITEVLPVEGIQQAVLSMLETRLEGLYLASIMASKRLVRSEKVRKHLRRVNRAEMTQVNKRTASEDHREAIELFRAKKRAKKAKL